MSFCPNCGAQNADNVAFCASCGGKLGAEQPVVQQPVYQAPVQPVYQQPVYQQPVYQQKPASVPGKGLGITGMVLGIIALVLFCVTYVSLPCAIIGAILSGIGLKKAKDVGMKNGMAVAGLVCSVIALAIDVVVWVLAASALAELTYALDYLM